MLFHFANLPYWLLLGLGLTCLSLVLLADDGDEELELEAESPALALYGLGWLGVGKVPLPLLLGIDFSLWGVCGWGLNVLFAQGRGQFPQGLTDGGLIVLGVSGVFSFWAGGLMARPLAIVWSSFGQDTSSERIIGCTGTVTSKYLPYLAEGRIGQAQVYDNEGNLLTVSVSLPHWATVIPHHNQDILIIEHLPQQRGYLVIAKDSSDEDKWLQQ